MTRLRPFEKEWHARIFALIIAMRDVEVLEPSVWAQALAKELRQQEGPNTEDGYYRCWLIALENMLTDRFGVDSDQFQKVLAEIDKRAQEHKH